MVVESKSLPERIAGIYYSHGVLCAAHPITVLAVAIATVLLTCIPLVNLPLPSNVPQTWVKSERSEKPRWIAEPPIYVQQVIMKGAVSPWTSEMVLTDAIRAPLSEVFRLVETIQNYRLDGLTISDFCTRVEQPLRELPLPQYNCLVVSPANFWHQDASRFLTDTNLVNTVYSHVGTQIGKSTLPELLFGMNLKEAGFKRYPLRNRQRVIQYAVTIFFTKYDKEFIKGLDQHLSSLYPLGNVTSDDEIVHIYHRGDFDFHEFLPLFFTYTVLFFYMYFSVRKIELVKSKVGVALSAVFTVMASLVMSIGLCLFFGLDPAGSSRGREVFPYLVVVVGLENVLVLTKSVVSTQAHLDAKIRVAQGLSKEGWGITKNLLAELTILTVGLFTLVPSIQEFCIFAMVGLLCDFFLQMCFFSTILSLDMRGLEEASDGLTPRLRDYASPPPTRLSRTRSAPRLDFDSTSRVPKRLRLVLFWGRTRIVQRAFMLVMIVWIGGFIYSAGILQNLLPTPEIKQVKYASLIKEGTILGNYHPSNKTDSQILKSPNAVPLQPIKWCYLTNVYNSSTSCRLSLLPPIRLGYLIPPERAETMRNPLEPPQTPFKWHSLAQALDRDEIEVSQAKWETPFLPTSPLEVLLVTALCVISILVISYASLALYHCICSRNYAQWRSAWANDQSVPDTTVVLQAVPLVLEGQGQYVEWLASDGNSVACSYLTGDVNVWDSVSGERLAHIDRKNYFFELKPKKEAKLPDLTEAMNFKFSNFNPRYDYENGYDYGPVVRSLYEESEEDPLFENCPNIWCMSAADNLIALGTSSGRIEFWEATSGKLKEIDDTSNVGATCIKMANSKCVIGRMDGALEIIGLDWCGSRRHVRTRSNGNISDVLSTRRTIRAHQQPITVLEVESGRILTGSRDHTLKVFSLQDELLVFTLHSHCGPITCAFIDSLNPMTSGSGSQDGMVCVWDLLTGACVYSLEAHDGPVTAMSYSPSYVLSLGFDEKLCVWDRFQGHLLNTVQLTQAYCTTMAMLTHNLLITSKQGSLVIWDVRTGEPVRMVKLGHTDSVVYVNTILPLRDSVVCDYGHSLRIVRFPLVRDKTD